jgi:hypothetical protein
VASLVKDKFLPAGIREIKGNLEGYPPAVYICTIKMNSSLKSFKLVKTED